MLRAHIVEKNCVKTREFNILSATFSCMAATLVAILEKQVDEKLHFNTKVLCAKFGCERPGGLGGVGGHTTHAHTQIISPPHSPNGPSTGGELLCGNNQCWYALNSGQRLWTVKTCST